MNTHPDFWVEWARDETHPAPSMSGGKILDAPVISVPEDALLPDTAQWQSRFKVKSESSEWWYVIGQHREERYWSCSCRGYTQHNHCKHLTNHGLPGDGTPFEAKLEGHGEA